MLPVLRLLSGSSPHTDIGREGGEGGETGSEEEAEEGDKGDEGEVSMGAGPLEYAELGEGE